LHFCGLVALFPPHTVSLRKISDWLMRFRPLFFFLCLLLAPPVYECPAGQGTCGQATCLKNTTPISGTRHPPTVRCFSHPFPPDPPLFSPPFRGPCSLSVQRLLKFFSCPYGSLGFPLRVFRFFFFCTVERQRR